uniref:Uncharacterized protein n=1 Tax=Thermofilum adornatum TaxID=1365176 RepID=A0A7C1GB20_9CREN
MAIIVLYFNYRTLKLNEKDRERPRVIELVQFCIVPFKEYLTTIGEYRPSFEEFDPKRILYRGINALYPDTFAVPRRSQPSPEMFLANFYALLEKLSQISGKLLPLRRRRRN